MPVIKSRSSTAEMQSPIVLHLGDLQREAERLEAEAVARARHIVEEAQHERKRLLSDAEQVGREQGYERGYSEGLEQGRSIGREEALRETRDSSNRLVESWGAALDTFEQIRADILHETRSSILTLAALVAEKVTRRAIQLDHSVAARHVEAAIELVQLPSRLTIRIHPVDRPSTDTILPDAIRRLGQPAHAQIIDDPSLTPGSVVVQTGHSTIDASIETQIQRLIEAILPIADQNPIATAAPPDAANDPESDH